MTVPVGPSADTKFTAATTKEVARMDIVTRRQATAIGAVAVILSALLSVVAGVVSARISGDSAAQVTAQQLAGETDKSRAEFLRSLRLDLYSKILQQMETLKSAEIDFADAAAYDPKRVDEEGEKYGKAFSAFKQTGSTVQILASPEVRQIYSQLLETHEAIQRAILDVLNARSNGGDTDRALGDVDKVTSPLSAQEAEFGVAARTDMGNR